MALRTNTLTRHFASNTMPFGMGWTKVYTETSGGSFTDVTSDAADAGTGDFSMIGASGDITNFGAATKFDFLVLKFDTNPSGGTRSWEYWNGSTWSSLTVTAITGNTNLTGSTHELKWTPPSDWATTSVNSTSAYWIRSVNATSYSTPGVGSWFAPGTIYDFGGQMTIDIPENSSRTIRAVKIRMGWHSSEVIPVYQTRVTCKLGAAGASYVVDSELDYGAGDDFYQTAVEIEFDATSYFVTNFGSGTSETFDLGGSFTHKVGGATDIIGTLENVWANIVITYEYDDASLTTATKTVFIPIESATDILSTSLTEIGTDQVPALDTFCPEASKSYKEICFVMQGASTGSGGNSGSANLTLALDSESEVAMCTLHYQSGDASITREVYHWVRNDLDTSTTHAFKARTTSTSIVGAPYFGGYIAVTYTYNASTSTTILNSLMIPIAGEASFINPANTSGDAGAGTVEFFVEEPATVTLKQSALLVAWSTDSGPAMRVKVGGQTSRTYTGAGSGNNGTFMSAFHRFDSSAAQGSGLTLARGVNRLTFEYYYGSSTSHYYQASNVNALMILNYTSGKAAAGVGAHNHTTVWPLVTGLVASTATAFVFSGAAPVIPESDYFATATGLVFWTSGGRGSGKGLNVKCERLSGEGIATGWVDLLHQNIYTSSRDGHVVYYVNGERFFRRGSWDPDTTRLEPETARRYVMTNASDSAVYWLPLITMYLTYHSITFAWSGTVVDGTSAPQSGATVTLHRNDTGEIIGTATTDGSGNYSIPWFDDTIEVHSQTRISGSLLGRSDDDVCT